MRTFVLAFVFTIVCALPVSLKAQEPVAETSTVNTKTLCEAFRLLTDHCDDFSQWIGSQPIPNSLLLYPSSLQIAGATASVFDKLSDMSFKAKYGTFATDKEAHIKASELQEAFKSCMPGVQFVSDYNQLNMIRSLYFADYGKEGFRLYKAAFQVNRSHELCFNYPQSTTFRGKKFKPYNDYRYITVAMDDSQFSRDFQRLQSEAFLEFTDIRGEINENDYGYDYYKPSFMPQGYTVCLIEVRENNQYVYQIQVNKELSLEDAKVAFQQLMSKIQLALGTDYAYWVHSDGSTANFVDKLHPLKKVATIYYKPNGKLYNLYFEFFS